MGGLSGGGNAILLLLTMMAVGGALLIALVTWRRNDKRVARTFLGGAGILTLAYVGGVITASAASSTSIIPQGDVKWFCGFYLDCHLGVSIERVETAETIDAGPKASGQFHILSLRMHNSAKNPNLDMLLYEPDARIVDALGNEYERSSAAEAAIGRTGRPGPLGSETTVSHEPVRATIVFDLPGGVQQPRLKLNQGWIVERAVELALIGDENSVLHEPTLMALDGTSRTASAVEQ